jgi:gentisate 1,2-dioxygenase
MESARHISAEEAERRVLILENPGLRGTSQVASSLYAGLQLIMPGETAPAHRHTQSALRFIVEGEGAYTTVDDRKVPMAPGDLVITPAWRWHLHGHEGTAPMVWLDGLDIPMTAHFNATFRQEGAERGPEPLAPAGSPIHFPYAESRRRLFEQAGAGPADPHAGHLLRFVDPAHGGWAMPTLATMIRLLPRGFATRPYRATDSMVFIVVEGAGEVTAGDETFAVAAHDVFVIPGWVTHAIKASEHLVLFSFSDRAAQEKLGFFRDGRL